jgi:hypothetical protein
MTRERNDAFTHEIIISRAVYQNRIPLQPPNGKRTSDSLYFSRPFLDIREKISSSEKLDDAQSNLQLREAR